MKTHLSLIAFILLLSSCLTLDRAINKVTKDETSAKVTLTSVKEKFPLATSRWAASAYPVVPKTTIVRDTVKTLVKIPGGYVDCPPASNAGTWAPLSPQKVQRIKCPDIAYYTSTISEQITTILENQAALEAKELELYQRDKELHDKEQELVAEREAHKATIEEGKPYKYIVYGLGLFVLLWVLWKFFRPRIPFIG